MQPLNIIFMGSPEFAVPSLNALHRSSHKILAVVSNPDKRRGRRSRPEPTDVKKRAIELGYKIIDADDVNSSGFAARLKELQPDLLVVVAFRILPPGVLAVPKLGAINLHASLLPKYRGAAPIHWAVINGEKETGCTIFFLNEKVDTGAIIKQEKTEIGPMETTGDIYNRLKNLGAGLLAEAVDEIAGGDVKAIPQNDELATPAPKLFAENTRLNFNQSAENVHNMIRGLNPFPVAWCNYEGEKMNVYASRPRKGESEPGLLYPENGRLMAGCGENILELTEVQLPGTKKLNGTEFINGYHLPVKLV